MVNCHWGRLTTWVTTRQLVISQFSLIHLSLSLTLSRRWSRRSAKRRSRRHWIVVDEESRRSGKGGRCWHCWRIEGQHWWWKDDPLSLTIVHDILIIDWIMKIVWMKDKGWTWSTCRHHDRLLLLMMVILLEGVLESMSPKQPDWFWLWNQMPMENLSYIATWWRRKDWYKHTCHSISSCNFPSIEGGSDWCG